MSLEIAEAGAMDYAVFQLEPPHAQADVADNEDTTEMGTVSMDDTLLEKTPNEIFFEWRNYCYYLLSIIENAPPGSFDYQLKAEKALRQLRKVRSMGILRYFPEISISIANR
jgi:hypothetical protein